jgi:hypothetical protein
VCGAEALHDARGVEVRRRVGGRKEPFDGRGRVELRKRLGRRVFERLVEEVRRKEAQVDARTAACAFELML